MAALSLPSPSALLPPTLRLSSPSLSLRLSSSSSSPFLSHGSSLLLPSRRLLNPKPSSLSAFPSAALSPLIDDDEEDDDDIAAAYEGLYGKPFAGLDEEEEKGASVGEDGGEEDDDKPKRRRRGSRRGAGGEGEGEGEGEGGRGPREGGGRMSKDNLEERLIQVRRVTKVVKGGKQLSFRGVVIVGDKKGKVGVGVGSAKEVVMAVRKAGVDARRHMVKVPLTKYLTFPHRFDGRFGAAKVMLRPAAVGTGVIAGGTVRTVLELAGVENALGKELGSGNPLNNARAVLDAVSNMKTWEDVSKARNIPIDVLRGKKVQEK